MAETEVRLALIRHTTRHLGDHGQEVVHVHEYVPGETMEEMARRVLDLDRPYYTPDVGDYVQVQVVVAAPVLLTTQGGRASDSLRAE